MPEDWRPCLTFHVLHRNPVVVAAVVGVLTVLVFLWRTVLAIEATLSVIGDEQTRCFRNFMAEQKVRRELEGQEQEVSPDGETARREDPAAHQREVVQEKKNLYKSLQEILEIKTELHHQKENILYQKLTQEELKRREMKSKLSKVEGRALQAEEELNLLRQKIAVREKKNHENWLKTRASERTLMEEKRECANLRQKIVELSNKMSDHVHSLYRSGPHDAPLTPPQPRGGQDMPHAPPEQQRAPHDTPPPSGTQS